MEDRAVMGEENKEGWAEHTALWGTCGVVGPVVSPIPNTHIHA